MKKSSDLLKLSPSSIKTYEQCARKWFFLYIQKAPKKEWAHLKLGTFVHEVLEDFHNALLETPSQPLSELMGLCFKEALPNHGLTKDAKLKAFDMLQMYLKILRKDGMPDVLSNEKPFTVKIDDTLHLRGVIDRVDRETDGFSLADYKSGASRYLDEFQLLVYALAIFEEHPELTKIRASYIMLKEGSKKISYTFSRTDADRAIEKVKKVANQIRTDQTWEPKPGFLCRYCDFEEICPATQTKRSADNSWAQTSKIGNNF